MKIIFLGLMLAGLVACSGNSANEEAEINASESEPVVENINVEEKSDEVINEIKNSEQEEVIAETSNSATPVISETTDSPTTVISNKQYKVLKNETLMWVAFKIYGDYSKWKELKELNKKVLKGSNIVRAGTVLQYMSDGTDFVWAPQGDPRLIKRGDTLGYISKDVYGTLKRWKDLWENNKPMIKDPNKIFAGFTLYYQPDTKKVALSSED